MKFLSDILAKAGLVVDGVVQFNNTATGQTPASGDNSTKLATTAFIKNQNYLTGNQTITLSGDATGSGTTSIAVTLADTGVTAGTYGNASSIPTITVDSKGRITSISTTAVSIVTTLAGLSDVQLSAQLIDKQVLQYNAATGKWVNASANIDPATTTTLGTIIVGAGLSVTVQGVLSVNGTGSARLVETFTATAGQTTFTVAQSYTVGLVDVYVNGVRLSSASYTASNGTTVVLADAAVAGDGIDIVKYTPLSGFAFTTDNVPEGVTNLYYTDARARAAISLTTTGVSGAATYNSSTGVLNIPNYQGLVPAGGVAGDILAKVSGTNYDVAWIPNYTSQVQHYVKLGETMTAGTPVYVTGSTGNSGTNMIVSKASNTTEAGSSKVMGLIATGGATNDIVFLITEGLLAGLNTSAAQIADPVWLGPNGTLLFGMANKPVAPAHMVYLGVVTRVQSNNGEIFVKVQNGFEIDELHDVLISSLADKHILYRDAATGLWKNASISTVLGYTPVTNARTLTINGTSYDLTANRSWSVGTVTSIGVSVPTGLSVSNSPITTSGTIAISFAAGYSIPTTASQSNWDTAYSWGNHASVGYALDNSVVHLAGTETITGDKTITGSLTITSTTKAFVPPRMTSAQRTAISSPAVGSIVYQTDGVEGLWIYTSTGWKTIAVV